MSSREVLKRLKAAGWYEARQSGSHVQLKHAGRPGVTTVPHPKRDFAIKTLRAIERQSGVKLLK